MPSGSVESLSADTNFPALSSAVNQSILQPLLTRHLNREQEVRLTGLEVLNQKPGRRCTIRYELDDPDRSPTNFRVIGKWQKNLDHAARLHQTLLWLGGQVDPRSLAFPRVLGFDQTLGLILQEEVQGTELRHLIAKGETEPFVAAGKWLAVLHALPKPSVLESKPITRETRKARGWRGEVAAQITELIPKLETTIEIPDVLAADMASEEEVVIHRDFYPANLMWDGETLWGLDFDQIALGDPGVDLGAFISQIEKIAIRDQYSPDLVYRLEQGFLSGYQSLRSIDLQPRLGFFRAYTLLKLAAGEVRRDRHNWRHLTERFVDRALEAAQGASAP